MKEFKSLAELEQWIEEYQIKNNVRLWKRDSRTIESMKRVCPHKLSICNPELKYYSLNYACLKGGRKFESQSIGLRNTPTHKIDCPMKIRIILSPDGQTLRIVQFHETHHHGLSKNSLKKTKSINFEKIQKERLLRKAREQRGIRYSAKLTKKSNEPNGSTAEFTVTDLEKTITLLEVGDNVAHIAVNEGSAFLGIYFQTPHMKKCFAEYPEILMFDSSYKLGDLDMPVYILMSINGNNQGDPVAVFVVTEENTDIIRHMIQVFKNQNLQWSSTEHVFVDKDFDEISVVQEEFMNATCYLCIIHSLEHFKIDITTESMNITSDEREKCLNILQNIISSKSTAEYNRFYNQLMDLNLANVSEYYNQHWHGIKEEWVETFRNKKLIYGVKTYCHLESFIQMIKANCDEHINLEGFFKNFLDLLNLIIAKRNQAADAMIPKKHTNAQLSDKILYLKLLTLHAFKLLLSHFDLITKFTVARNDTYCDVKSIKSPVDMYKVDMITLKCTCSFNKSHHLPCEHIFAVKFYEKSYLYDETLVHRRHLKLKYIELYRSRDALRTAKSEHVKLLTTQQKYNIALIKCKELAKVVSNLSDSEFEARCDVLDSFIKYWSNGNTSITINSTNGSYRVRKELRRHKHKNYIEFIDVDTDEPKKDLREIKMEQDQDMEDTVEYLELDSDIDDIEDNYMMNW